MSRVRALLLCLLLAGSLQAAPGALTYATYLGGDGADVITALAVDTSNNVYLTGYTLSSNFPVTAGAFQRKHAGQPGTITGLLSQFPTPVPDAFVVKLNPQGQLVYATYLGGAGSDSGYAIAVDSAGNAFVAGGTNSANFPVTTGALQTHLGGNFDIFVAKLSPDGSTLLGSTLLGGSGYDTVAAIALDATGNIYLGGTGASDFPMTAGAYRTQGGGAFAAKLNTGLTALLYSTFLGDDGSGGTTGLAIDVAGSAYAGGTTYSAAFPITTGTFHTAISSGKSAAFLVKLNPAGTGAVYSAIFGGQGYSSGGRVALDTQGSPYLSGSTDAADFPVSAAAFQRSLAGEKDAFILKMNNAGSDLVYATLLGGSGTETASGLAVDAAGNAYLSGSTFSSDFPVTPDALPRRFAGSPCLATGGSPFGNPPFAVPCGDAFAAKLNATGSALAYSTYLSGSDGDAATAAALTGGSALYIAGWTRSNNFPVAGSPLADTRSPATCTISESPSSIQHYPCEDGFLARIDFTGVAAPPALRVVNFGSLLETPVAPAEVVTLFGSGIGPETPATLQLDAANQITSALANTRVLFDGVAAPLIRVDATQITAIVPNSVAGKSHSLVSVQLNGQTTASTTVVIGTASPALLTLDPSGLGPCAAINLDETLNSVSSPVPAGSIVSLFAIGMGASGQPDGALATVAANLAALPVVVVGNQLAHVLYAGPSPTTTAASTQINIQLPPGATGKLPVFVLNSGFSSQFGVTLFVK